MSSREDPMFNLLSSVGGIDSSRFLKPQSMKDQRVGRSQLSDRPPEVSSSQKSKKEYNGFQIPPGQSARGAFSKEAVSNVPFMSSKSSQRIPSGDTNSQLDALLSGSVSSKEMRYCFEPTDLYARTSVVAEYEASMRDPSNLLFM